MFEVENGSSLGIKPPELAESLHGNQHSATKRDDVCIIHAPDTQEIDLHVNGKGLLEYDRFNPTIRRRVHLICNRGLPPIVEG